MNSKTPDEADDASATAWRTTELAFPDEPTRLVKHAPASVPAPADVAEHALPAGTAIEGFRIVRPIGEGGFAPDLGADEEARVDHVPLEPHLDLPDEHRLVEAAALGDLDPIRERRDVRLLRLCGSCDERGADRGEGHLREKTHSP